MLERAKETTRFGKYTYIEYARFADDLVILIDAHPRHDWLMGVVERRLRQELAELQVEINEEKSRNVDLGRGESFGFLGFDFRRVRSRRGVWCAQYTPKLKKRTALLRKLKDVFRRYQSQPLDRVIKLINPMLRGWVAYFAVGNSSECFGFVKDWWKRRSGAIWRGPGTGTASAGSGGVRNGCTNLCGCTTATRFDGACRKSP
jgi:RNA-directed DNA polymerase